MIRELPQLWRERQNKRDSITPLLDALDVETATPDDVAKIIGDRSWTRLECDECNKEVDAILNVGEPLGYALSVNICFHCVKKAADLITTH